MRQCSYFALLCPIPRTAIAAQLLAHFFHRYAALFVLACPGSLDQLDEFSIGAQRYRFHVCIAESDQRSDRVTVFSYNYRFPLSRE